MAAVHFYDRMGLHPPQRAFLSVATGSRCKNPIVGYGGAGGGGKSYGLRALCVYSLLKLYDAGFGGLPVLLATTDYPRLADRHISKILAEYSWLGAELRTSAEHRLHIRFKNASGLGVIRLRNLANPDGFRGSEVPLVAVDEPTELKAKIRGEPLMGLMLYPLRLPVDTPFKTWAGAMNPDGIGHAVMKGWFITGELVLEKDRHRVSFIRALSVDNPTIGEEWYSNLEYLSPETKKARLLGLWDAPKGMRWPRFTRRTHTFRFAERFPQGIPGSFPLHVGVDYGIAAPFCALWSAVDEAGNVWIYREAYQAGLTAYAQALLIQEMTGSWERNITLHPDNQLWQKVQIKEAGADLPDKTLADDYRRVLGPDPRFGSMRASYKDMTVGMAAMDRYLDQDDPSPNVYIEEGCENLIREITEAQFDQRGGNYEWSELLDPSCMKHALDAMRYLLVFRIRPASHREQVIDLAAAVEAATMRRIREHERKHLRELGKRSARG